MKKVVLIIMTSWLFVACSPTVKVQASDKPIEINLNVKIDHEIRVKVDKDIDAIVAQNPDIF